MTTSARIARLEGQGYTLLRRIKYAQSLYDSDRLEMAVAHLQAAVADLQIAKIGAQVRAPWRRVEE